MTVTIYNAAGLIGTTYSGQMAKFQQFDTVRRFFNHKLKHTFGVSSLILDIMLSEKSIASYITDDVKKMVDISAILHDIGRFYQFDENGEFIPNHIFHHGQKSVDLIKDMPEFNNPMILFAIISHDNIAIDYTSEYYTNLSDNDKKIADIMAKLLRDADKLENMRNFVVNGAPKYKILKTEPLSEDVKHFIRNKTLVDRRFVKTSADMIADLILWVNDINFNATKDIIKRINYLEVSINEFSKCGASKEDVELVREMVTI
ncbi:HD domain-containing protein [bacterium]|nr:HD domain-containing protein [bacterium]